MASLTETPKHLPQNLFFTMYSVATRSRELLLAWTELFKTHSRLSTKAEGIFKNPYPPYVKGDVSATLLLYIKFWTPQKSTTVFIFCFLLIPILSTVPRRKKKTSWAVHSLYISPTVVLLIYHLLLTTNPHSIYCSRRKKNFLSSSFSLYLSCGSVVDREALAWAKCGPVLPTL